MAAIKLAQWTAIMYIIVTSMVELYGTEEHAGTFQGRKWELLTAPMCANKSEFDGRLANSGNGIAFRDNRLVRSHFAVYQRVWKLQLLTWKISGQMPQGLSMSTVISVIHMAFSKWSYPTSNLRFARASTKPANLNIKFVSGDHGDGYPFEGKGRVLAHAYYPPSGDIHFDLDESWTVPAQFLSEKGRINHQDNRGSWLNLYSVATHEIGHALGLRHNDDINSIMFAHHMQDDEPKLSINDKILMRYLYGPCKISDLNEMDNDPSTERDSGTVRRQQSRRSITTRRPTPWKTENFLSTRK